jgi:hypothetical protein
MTSPLVQIDGQHLNLGTFDAVRLNRFEEGKSLLFAQPNRSPAALAHRPLAAG